jgi:alkylation response protein AidB-like acyl-CoA dehydrogenase
VTIGEWLADRRPAPPPALRARIAALLAGSVAHDVTETSDACLEAAERLVQRLLAGNSTTRDSALDLLTADALVTYAFEAAGEAHADLVGRASAAMIRIASIGVTTPGQATA